MERYPGSQEPKEYHKDTVNIAANSSAPGKGFPKASVTTIGLQLCSDQMKCYSSALLVESFPGKSVTACSTPEKNVTPHSRDLLGRKNPAVWLPLG